MKNYKKIIPLLLILILGSALRFYHIGEKSLWLDEASSLYRAEQSFSVMLQEIVQNDAHPPLYNTLLHAWVRLRGKIDYPESFSPEKISEAWIRSLSACLGIASLLVIYQIGKLFWGRETGRLASLIMACSSYQIFYAQEARLGTLITLLVLLSFYFFYQGLREGRKRFWVGFIISTIFSLYTFLYAFFIVFGQHLFLIFHKKYRFRLKPFLISEGIIALLFIPWIHIVLARIILAQSAGSVSTLGFQKILEIIHLFLIELNFGYTLHFMSGLKMFTLSTPPILLIPLFLFLITILFGWRKEKKKDISWLLLFWFIFPLFMIFIFPFKMHDFQSKHLIFSFPAYYLLLARGITKFQKKKLGEIILLLFLLFNFASLYFYYQDNFIKEDWRKATNYIEENFQENEVILFNPPYLGFPFDYYHKEDFPRAGINKQTFSEKALALKTSNYSSIWLVQSHSSVSRPSITKEDWFEEGYEEKEVKVFAGINGFVIISRYNLQAFGK